jgi:hypothetical protein
MQSLRDELQKSVEHELQLRRSSSNLNREVDPIKRYWHIQEWQCSHRLAGKGLMRGVREHVGEAGGLQSSEGEIRDADRCFPWPRHIKGGENHWKGASSSR